VDRDLAGVEVKSGSTVRNGEKREKDRFECGKQCRKTHAAAEKNGPRRTLSKNGIDMEYEHHREGKRKRKHRDKGEKTVALKNLIHAG